ncbi:MAG: hypothetical protein R2788_09960 [Saprospiraceae bacterium]
MLLPSPNSPASTWFTVTIQKFDPYKSTSIPDVNPYEHGECYVTEDGAETDLDLGHYERFLNTPTSKRIMLPLEGFTKRSSKGTGWRLFG